MSIGTVSAIWRYPVKSMQGTTLPSAWLDESGILGDRAYTIRDVESGTVASAKHPLKWQSLLRCEATYVANPEPGEPLPGVVIRLPNGVVVEYGEAAADASLSEFFGAEVSLETRPEGDLLGSSAWVSLTASNPFDLGIG